jgi:hypothetical protein
MRGHSPAGSVRSAPAIKPVAAQPPQIARLHVRPGRHELIIKPPVHSTLKQYADKKYKKTMTDIFVVNAKPILAAVVTGSCRTAGGAFACAGSSATGRFRENRTADLCTFRVGAAIRVHDSMLNETSRELAINPSILLLNPAYPSRRLPIGQAPPRNRVNRPAATTRFASDRIINHDLPELFSLDLISSAKLKNMRRGFSISLGRGRDLGN